MKLPKKIMIAALLIANAGVLILLFSVLNVGHADQLTLSDLNNKAVDMDGDGKYKIGDDLALELFLKHHPDHVNKALKQARIMRDGGVDLSPYFMSEKFQR